MKKNVYICNAKQQHDVLGIHKNIAHSVSSCCTSAPSSRGCLATISKRVRSLFVHTKRKTCSTMPNNNKQATTAKNSTRSAKMFRCQAIYFGWLTITRHFSNKADAVAWYNRHQQGWRYRHAVAVIWQGCTRNTPTRFLTDALFGGDEWKLAMCHHILCQADCDYILYSDDYNRVCEYECAGR